MRRKQAIAIFLIVVAALSFLYATFGVSTPDEQWTSLGAYYLNSKNYNFNAPPVYFTGAILFTASGSLSVNNPIRVSALIYYVNITDSDFLKDYASIGFTNAFPVNPKANSNNLIQTGVLPIVQSGPGKFWANGTLTWLASGDSYLLLVPRANYSLTLQNSSSHPKSEPPAITINPVSDTLSTAFNDNTLRLTFILVGLSFLMLQPVLEALFPDRRG